MMAIICRPPPRPSHRGATQKDLTMKPNLIKSAALAGLLALAPVAASADDVPAKDVADMLHAVMDSDRTIYTKMIVQRLVNDHKLIKASEFFEDDKAAPLPAQMFRFGAEAVADFYAEEELGGEMYLTAIYPDVAVAEVCATCHNEHKDSPKTDFKVGDVMGGVVIRIPLDG